MRNWKNWLFPILTVLTVAALALLPLRLSTLRDGELTGTVHTEELSADSNFPFKPPDLPGRVWLLVQWMEMPDGLTIMAQELEGADRDREIRRLREALTDLGGLLSPEAAAVFTETDGDSWEWNRYYLRDQTDLSSASFIVASTYDKARRSSLSATLDAESGQILSFHFRRTDGFPGGASPQELGEALLDRLGLDCVPALNLDSLASFSLPDCGSEFWLALDSQSLDFHFTVDWSAVDAETAEAYGYSTDADSMQIW